MVSIPAYREIVDFFASGTTGGGGLFQPSLAARQQHGFQRRGGQKRTRHHEPNRASQPDHRPALHPRRQSVSGECGGGDRVVRDEATPAAERILCASRLGQPRAGGRAPGYERYHVDPRGEPGGDRRALSGSRSRS